MRQNCSLFKSRGDLLAMSAHHHYKRAHGLEGTRRFKAGAASVRKLTDDLLLAFYIRERLINVLICLNEIPPAVIVRHVMLPARYTKISHLNSNAEASGGSSKDVRQ